jgi:hyaluronan synthase
MKTKIATWAGVVAIGALAVGFHLLWEPTMNFAFVVYIVIFAMLIFNTVFSLLERKRPQTQAKGRVVAVVPVYNESQEVVERCVQALLDQARVPDHIYVIDDGSKVPIVPFEHPRVSWLRQENKGKRHAQSVAFEREPNADFFLTVDSDVFSEPDALAEAMREFSDPAVQGVTAMLCTSNWRKSILTRLIDLDMVMTCLGTRAARSFFGAVAPASGNFAVYRAANILNNLDDYLTSGTAGDDRRLTHYCLLAGRVVAVESALIHTLMPETVRELYAQRVRWFRSYFRYLYWEMKHLSGPALWFRIWNLYLLIIYPIIMAYVLVLWPIKAHTLVWHGFAYWAIVEYLMTLRYLTSRPNMAFRDRLINWALSPLLVVYQFFIIRPAQYVAMTKVRASIWNTRGQHDHMSTRRKIVLSGTGCATAGYFAVSALGGMFVTNVTTTGPDPFPAVRLGPAQRAIERALGTEPEAPVALAEPAREADLRPRRVRRRTDGTDPSPTPSPSSAPGQLAPADPEPKPESHADPSSSSPPHADEEPAEPTESTQPTYTWPTDPWPTNPEPTDTWPTDTQPEPDPDPQLETAPPASSNTTLNRSTAGSGSEWGWLPPADQPPRS